MIINLNIPGLEIDYKKLSEAIVCSLQHVLPKEIITEINHPQPPPDKAIEEPDADAKKIRALLLLENITCAELTKELGVSRTWISLVVNGHKKSNRIRKAIAYRLGKKVEDLWPSNGKGTTP